MESFERMTTLAKGKIMILSHFIWGIAYGAACRFFLNEWRKT